MSYRQAWRRFALPAAALLTSLLGVLPISRAGGRRDAGSAALRVYVFPIPGGHLASPRTQITFRGLSATQLQSTSIAVLGSRSGAHRGAVVADSDKQGGSFLPKSRFTAGETVTVHTSLNIAGGRRGTFHFTVADPAPRSIFSVRNSAPRVRGDIERFRSRPDLVPAAVRIRRNSSRSAPGDIFLGPQAGPINGGPMIRDRSGRLIWFKPLPRNHWVSDFRVQTLFGRRVLTWWQGVINNGVGAGEDVIVDANYRTIAVLRAANGLNSDLHEFLITPRDTALITAYFPVFSSRRSAGRSGRVKVFDAVVQEIDIPTGLVLYQWDSLDHVPLSATFQHRAGSRQPWDYFHLNSIQDRGDDLLVSSRNTWAAYLIDHRTGHVHWTLGGKHSSFRRGRGAQFVDQHDVRLHPPNTLTVFDNGGGPPAVHSQSRALTLRLNLRRHIATVVSRYVHSPPLRANFEGNMQRLPGGDTFVGWGQQPYFSEYNSRGQMIFDGRFVDANLQYRAYRFRWNATPLAPPDLAASSRGRSTTVYASWNGATDVVYWRVLAGSSPTALKPVKTARSRGFETSIAIGFHRYVAVQALSQAGHALGGRSRAVRT